MISNVAQPYDLDHFHYLAKPRDPFKHQKNKYQNNSSTNLVALYQTFKLLMPDQVMEYANIV